ncbi:MAG TPA: metallophosphoesterase [Bacteroidales bacterium]|nr:metallophosphoesterase [Bacteroidales bacterium]
MGNKLKILIALLVCAVIYSCDVDFSGFIRSTDRVEDRFVQSIEYNESNPKEQIIVNSSEYEVLAASDLHVGPTVNTEKLLNLYDASDAVALILAGDIVSGRREHYEIFKELAEEVTKPLLMVTGNHDLYFDGWKSFYEFFGSSTYYFNVTTPDTSDLYICLDIGGGTLGKSQLAWLEEVLEQNRENCRYCIVACHVNILRTRRTSSANPLVEEVACLIDLFAKYNVNLVITGHDHVQDVAKIGNTTFIILDALEDSYSDAGYLKVISNPDTLKYEFIRFD